MLAVIVSVALALSVAGLDWGLPYQWHTDEKVTQAIHVLDSPRWDPDYFINPHLHIYVVAAAFKVAYLVYPGTHVVQSVGEILPLVDRDSSERRAQFLAMRLARGASILFGLATVVMVFLLGRRHWGEATGLLAAAFTAVTMGLVNLWHFATPEALLILLICAALGRFERVLARGDPRDYVIAAACVGLACSTKYTAVILAVPFLGAHLAGRGRSALHRRGLLCLLLATVIVAAAFIAGTPLLIPDWRQFWEWGVVYNWYTGAPTGSLIEVKRSYLPYIGLLGDALGWPLCAASVLAVIAGIRTTLRGDRATAAWSGSFIHTLWIVAFYGFYGLSPHHALRFIVPIAPSLALLTASAATSLVRRPAAATSRRLVWGTVAALLMYSTVYTARADFMFEHDTRYAAGTWLNQAIPGRAAEIDYFAIEAYLPYFSKPAFALHHEAFIEQVTLHGAAFWNRADGYLRNSSAPIVDSNFYYDRFLDYPKRFPERAAFYRYLLTGTDPAGVRPIARFTFENPWWLNPRPERIAPEVVVFGK
jgi:hypothetical protein